MSSSSPAPLLPPSRISHRAMGGPDLNYLYATDGPSPTIAAAAAAAAAPRDEDASITSTNNGSRGRPRPMRRGLKSDRRSLRGTSLYLGGEEGTNSKIYCIPGHASRVLCIDTATDDVYPIGPVYDASNCILGGKFKWLRGIVVGNIIYGLPCHSDRILRIDTSTDIVSTLDVPYEEYFDDGVGRGQDG